MFPRLRQRQSDTQIDLVENKELGVLALYEARHSNREISDLLGISMNQVKYLIQTGRISPGKSTGQPHKLSTEQ
ncbi:hypothetical protein K3495_g16728 [Podosphaera aphanis]|nr:hypothetical protein K3495_g16728 [Podosphaera aphanis]